LTPQNIKRFELVYNDSLGYFKYNDLKPFTNYTLQIIAVKEETDSMRLEHQSMKTKVIQFTTKKGNSLYKRAPDFQLKLLKNGQNLIKLDWTKSFMLNSRLINYKIIFNNNSVIYIGNGTVYETAIGNNIKCNNDSIRIDDSKEGIIIINCEILAQTEFGVTSSGTIKIPIHCSMGNFISF
jgi:hypothetical protein